MPTSPITLEAAVRMWQHVPYRRCWIASKQGETDHILLEATALRVNALVRQGWTALRAGKVKTLVMLTA